MAKRAALTLAAGATFLELYLLPTEHNEAPSSVRLVPAW
jgi:hypothetical protein